MKESISHLVLFNHINHSNPTLFVDLRLEDTFKTCHLRNAHLVKLEQCKAGGLISALSHVSKRNSYMLIFVTDASVDNGSFGEVFIEIEELVTQATKSDSTKEASPTLAWSNFSTVEHVDFPSFFEAYPACASLYEGENYPSTKRIFKHYSSEIVSGFMYLGSYYDATDEVIMSDMRITHVVDATSEHMSQALATKLNLTYLHIPVWDMEGVDITQYFSTVLDFVQQARVAQGRVLIHCRAGISRSSTLVMVCMMTHGQVKSLQEAVHHVVTQRPYVLPNPSFRDQLRAYEESLFGTSSFATDAEMLAFISSINFCWSGIFAAETDFDRIPIIAASKQLNAVRLQDMFPTEEEKEKNELKPKKPFLIRGPRRPAANSKTSTASATLSEATATDSTEPFPSAKVVISKKAESLRDLIRARKVAVQSHDTNAFVPIVIPTGDVPVVDTANPTAGTGITAARALKSPQSERKSMPVATVASSVRAQASAEVKAPESEVFSGELVHTVVRKVIGSEAVPPVPPTGAEEGMLLRDWRNNVENMVDVLPPSPSKAVRT
eukprot:gene8364-9939_t